MCIRDRTQTTPELYDKYAAIVADIYTAGEGYTASDADSLSLIHI